MSRPVQNILLVVDDPFLYEDVCASLKKRGWGVVLETEVPEAIKKLRSETFACCIVADGESSRVRDVLTSFGVSPTLPVVGVVRSGDVATTVDAMKLGAHSVVELENEADVGHLVAAVEDSVPKGSAPIHGDPRDLFVRSEHSSLNALLAMLPSIAQAPAPVLISGESGTGKELFARTIHNMSPRASGPFIAVNCGAIPDTLLESELFGYVKGAFTGAHADHTGQFAAAHRGTILLDEIGELPLALQVRLLRVLQDGKVVPVGSSVPIAIDFRVIAATNRNLEAEVKAGNFREDLYYRLSVLPLHVPALRDRPEDIPITCEHFLQEQNRLNKTHLQGFDQASLRALKGYKWPGNVREVQNLMQRLSILKRVGFVEPIDLPSQFHGDHPPPPQLGLYVPSEGMDMADTLERLETSLVRQALQKSEGNKAAAARLLGLNRTTLVEKVKRLRIDDE